MHAKDFCSSGLKLAESKQCSWLKPKNFGAQLRNQLDRQAYEEAWQDSLAREPSPFRRQHGVGIRVRLPKSAYLWTGVHKSVRVCLKVSHPPSFYLLFCEILHL